MGPSIRISPWSRPANRIALASRSMLMAGRRKKCHTANTRECARASCPTFNASDSIPLRVWIRIRKERSLQDFDDNRRHVVHLRSTFGKLPGGVVERVHDLLSRFVFVFADDVQNAVDAEESVILANG